MFEQTVTFYRKDENEVYTKVVICGVYWQPRCGYDSAVQRPVDEIQIIIPASTLPNINPGDLVISGVGNDISRARDLVNPKVVSSVNDYRHFKSGLAHIEVIAK